MSTEQNSNEDSVKKVNIYVSKLLEDLDNGLTWFKKDNIGYGSIEEKYGAREKQIDVIRRHPSLKNAQPAINIFNIIDDTKDEVSETESPKPTESIKIETSKVENSKTPVQQTHMVESNEEYADTKESFEAFNGL